MTPVGTCDNLSFVVNWSDPNGDAAKIIVQGDSAPGGRTEAISGGQGVTTSSDYTCTSDHCVNSVIAVDAAGNRSNLVTKATTCTIGG